MDWFAAVFVVPEVCLLLLGFFAIAVSLSGSAEADKLRRLFKSRGREVDASYWGQYIKAHEKGAVVPIPAPSAIAASTSATASGIVLPKLLKAPEP